MKTLFKASSQWRLDQRFQHPCKSLSSYTLKIESCRQLQIESRSVLYRGSLSPIGQTIIISSQFTAALCISRHEPNVTPRGEF